MGKLISTGGVLWMNSGVFNLYDGTIETTGTNYAVYGRNTVNLYGGKIKSSGDTISYAPTNETRINLDGTVLACGEGYAHFKAEISYNECKSIIDVTDYIGDSLIVRVDVFFSESATIKLLEGIKNAEEAEKYIVNFSSKYNSCYLEKTEYEETTGEMYLYVVKKCFHSATYSR